MARALSNMLRLLCFAHLLVGAPAAANEANGFREDARSIEKLVNDNYAYLERLPAGTLLLSAKLKAEADKVTDRNSLLRFAERLLFTLADHHAITGASFPDSWAVVPSYSDLWIGVKDEAYIVEAVRPSSPSKRAGIRTGDLLVSIGGIPISQAVADFWSDLGMSVTNERAAFAARVVAAGRRDRMRLIGIKRSGAASVQLSLANLYSTSQAKPPVSVSTSGGDLIIKINNALGGSDTVTAFDQAMLNAKPRQRIILDLTDTPGGGNTVVARAIMGWFVSKPTAYQVHRLPSEERRTGIPRQWVEQVLPRPGKRHKGPVAVRVGRWTGSMGEGLAIGFDAIGARVIGDRMAGLRGAIYDYKLPASGLILKLPAERLMSVNGVAREDYVPNRR